MKDTFRTLSALIHAPSKVGKSTLSSTAPTPMVVADVEGGWKFINHAGFNGERPLRKRLWDPIKETPPRFDDTWDVCVVPVHEWRTLVMLYNNLAQQPHDFRTAIIDSVTEAQRKLKANLRGLEQMRIQDWGDLLGQMDKIIRDTRDLVLLPANTLEFVMFIAETELKDGKWRPAMQGQIGRAMPYWVDIVGYLFATKANDENGQPTKKQVNLLIGGDDQFESGERVQGRLPNVIENPNIQSMINMVFDGVEARKEQS